MVGSRGTDDCPKRRFVICEEDVVAKKAWQLRDDKAAAVKSSSRSSRGDPCDRGMFVGMIVNC